MGIDHMMLNNYRERMVLEDISIKHASLHLEYLPCQVQHLQFMCATNISISDILIYGFSYPSFWEKAKKIKLCAFLQTPEYTTHNLCSALYTTNPLNLKRPPEKAPLSTAGKP